jgi:hypothetical protein
MKNLQFYNKESLPGLNWYGPNIMSMGKYQDKLWKVHFGENVYWNCWTHIKGIAQVEARTGDSILS